MGDPLRRSATSRKRVGPRRGGSAAMNSWAIGPSGLAIRSGTTRSRGTIWASLGGLAHGADREGPARFLVPRQGVGAEHAVADQAGRTPPRSGGAAHRGVRGCRSPHFSSSKVGSSSFQEARAARERLEPGRLGDGDGQVDQPVGQVADRRGVVDHRRRDLIDVHLPGGVGLLLVEPLELGNVDPHLAVGRWPSR